MFRRVRYSSARQTSTKLYAAPPLTSRAFQSRTGNSVSVSKLKSVRHSGATTDAT